jgi:hypothetical protein
MTAGTAQSTPRGHPLLDLLAPVRQLCSPDQFASRFSNERDPTRCTAWINLDPVLVCERRRPSAVSHDDDEWVPSEHGGSALMEQLPRARWMARIKWPKVAAEY